MFNSNRAKAVIGILLGSLLAMKTPHTSAQELSLDEWVRGQLSGQKLERVTILDVRLWSDGPRPNTYIILALGTKKPETIDRVIPNFPQESQDLVVLLAQSDRSSELHSPNLMTSYTLSTLTRLAGTRPRTSIDVGPYQIRESEYAFGIRTIVDVSVGNKGGLAFEYISLFRYQSSEIKKILDDVTWGYSKYSEPGLRSCNTETILVSDPAKVGEFFILVRKYFRSYLGDARMYPQYADVGTPVASCPFFDKLQSPNSHTWDAKQGVYVDAERSTPGV